MKHVAVFGISGFSGRHFERCIATNGWGGEYRFFGFARNLREAAHSGVFTYYQGDARDEKAITSFISEIQPEYVLNLVGRFRAETLGELLVVNVGVSAAICEAVRKSQSPIKKILLVGSAAEYGEPFSNPVCENVELHPVSAYGLTKVYQTLLAQYYFQTHRLPVVLARTFNILGDGLSCELSVGSFTRQLQELPDGGILKVGNLSTTRDFLDISVVSDRYWRLLMDGEPGEVYNVCSGVPRMMRDVLQELILKVGKRVAIETDPSLFKEKDINCIFGDTSKYDRLVQ